MTHSHSLYSLDQWFLIAGLQTVPLHLLKTTACNYMWISRNNERLNQYSDREKPGYSKQSKFDSWRDPQGPEYWHVESFWLPKWKVIWSHSQLRLLWKVHEIGIID